MKNVKIGICQWCIPAEGPEALQLAADMGYDGVEMDMGFGRPERSLLVPEVLDAFLAAKQSSGMETPSLAFNGLSLKNPEIRGEREEILRQSVEAARKLNVKVLQMPSFFADGIKTEEDFVETARSLKYLCRLAADAGMVVGSENQLDAEQNLRLIRAVDEENFAVYFDNANPYLFDHRDGMELLKTLYPHICEVHIKDFSLWGRKPCRSLGRGRCHAADVLRFLKENGYDRWIVAENSLSAEKLKQDAEWIRKKL